MRTLPLLASALALSAFAACGDDSGSGTDASHADSPNGSDGSGGQHITVSGATADAFGNPVVSATVAAYLQSDDSQISTTTSDGTTGAFSVAVPYSGTAVAIYLKGTKTGQIDTYLYPPASLSADLGNVPLLIIDMNTETLLLNAAGATQTPGDGLIGLEVEDPTTAPIAGAMISSTPAGTYRYDAASSSTPSPDATVTGQDGRAYVISVAPGAVTVNATMTGKTFAPTAVKARPDVLTLTTVIGQ
ncbi:MAG TPA: hypothetical protein VGM88_20095 [Kofleriaceae bacterium]|jgi:protocatechuate 3,4-dioxygenase beta subunit